MPHSTKLDSELGVVVIRYHGEICLEEFRNVLDELKALPGLRPGLTQEAPVTVQVFKDVGEVEDWLGLDAAAILARTQTEGPL